MCVYIYRCIHTKILVRLCLVYTHLTIHHGNLSLRTSVHLHLARPFAFPTEGFLMRSARRQAIRLLGVEVLAVALDFCALQRQFRNMNLLISEHT